MFHIYTFLSRPAPLQANVLKPDANATLILRFQWRITCQIRVGFSMLATQTLIQMFVSKMVTELTTTHVVEMLQSGSLTTPQVKLAQTA